MMTLKASQQAVNCQAGLVKDIYLINSTLRTRDSLGTRIHVAQQSDGQVSWT